MTGTPLSGDGGGGVGNRPFLEGFLCPGKRKKVIKAVPFIKMVVKHEGEPKHLNLIALRMAKTLWSFGHSKSNRVKKQN